MATTINKLKDIKVDLVKARILVQRFPDNYTLGIQYLSALPGKIWSS